MDWLAFRMSTNNALSERAFQPGGWIFIQNKFSEEMQSHLRSDHTEHGVKFPGIPNALVQTNLSGRVKPSHPVVTGPGEIMLEFFRDLGDWLKN